MIYSILTILFLIPILLIYRLIVFIINLISLLFKFITSIIGNIILPFYIIYEANRFNKSINSENITFNFKFRFSDINLKLKIEEEEMLLLKDLFYYTPKNEKIRYFIKRLLK